VITFTCTYTFAAKWFAVGHNGFPIIASVNGNLWSPPMGPQNQWLNDIAYGAGVFVAIGVGATYTSIDGQDWDLGDAPPSGYEYTGIVFADNRFVMVDSANGFFYTYDGITWMDASLLNNPYLYYDVCWGNGRFVAVGSTSSSFAGAAFTDTGTSWTLSPLDGKRLNGVAWVEGPMGFFVAVGHNGGIHWSFDGGGDWEWNDVSVGGSELMGVAYGDGNMVAVGKSGRVVHASKGGPSNWNSANVGGGDLRDVTFGGGKFIAVGNGGRRMVSYNGGDTWSQIATGGPDLYSIIYKP